MKRTRLRICGLCAIIGGALALAGCGAAPNPPVPVAGQVTQKDKGLAGVVICLWPKDPQNKRQIDAEVDKEGRFVTAAPKGRYKVTVSPIHVQGNMNPVNPKEGSDAARPKDEPKTAKPKLKDKYMDSIQTDLIIEVPEGGVRDLIIKVD